MSLRGQAECEPAGLDFIRQVMPELRAFHEAPQNSEFQVDRLIRNVGGFPIHHAGPHHFDRDAVHLVQTPKHAASIAPAQSECFAEPGGRCALQGSFLQLP